MLWSAVVWVCVVMGEFEGDLGERIDDRGRNQIRYQAGRAHQELRAC